jgi:hypothetical protein
MCRKPFIMLLLLLACGLLFAQNPQLSIQCAPSEIFMNNLATSAFDPVNPQNQPILTNVRIQNMTQQPFRYCVNLNVRWNDILLVDSIKFKSREQIQPGMPPPYLTNRDFITQNAGNVFESPDGDISLNTIINASTTLRDALQSGFFPDGTITFEFSAAPDDIYVTDPVPSVATFTIRVKNITNIFLSFPGRPIGQTPPVINARPVTFLWNSLNTAYNSYNLVIMEFTPNNPPDINSVETSGRRVYVGEHLEPLFNEYLPFQDRHYYAWQVTSAIIDETNPVQITGKQSTSQAGEVKSEWFVFKYSSDFGSTDSYYQQLLAYLNMLNNAEIQNVFAQGFRITGAVFFEGQAYTGKDAVELVKPLIGKDITVEFTD